MLGWRKRNDGFEWREYVRTTILVRREKRRQKIEELREAAVAQVKEAGEKGVRAGAAGAERVGRAAREGLEGAARSLDENVIRKLRRGLAAGAGRAAVAGRAAAGRMGRLAADDGARKVVLGGAMLAAFWAAARYTVHGLDREATVALALAVAALALAGLMALAASEDEDGDGVAAAMRAVAAAPMTGMATKAVAAFATVTALGWMLGLAPSNLTGGVAGSDARSSAPAARGAATGGNGDAPGILSGRATAVTGDTLRIGGRLVRLTGIEAPEREQTCALANGRPWNCGSGATQALASRVRSKPVECAVTEADGTLGGTCRIDGADVAAELVQGGHVFAEAGWFARYASHEAEAKDARAGLWRGEAVRPSEYRTRRWEEAQRTAPDGCPIKGQMTSDRRVYVLPWAPQYDRVKVRTARGERWFCSEAEAKAAGWQPSERS